MAMPGPPELGRGVVVLPGEAPPDPWKAQPRIRIADETLADPVGALEILHQAWFGRQPVVVELAVDPRSLRQAQVCHQAVYDLSPRFEFSRERLLFLVWANNYDARAGDPVWWHGRKAARRFANKGVHEGGRADVMLADGPAMFVDGGPPQPPVLRSAIGVVHRWNAEAGRLEV